MSGVDVRVAGLSKHYETPAGLVPALQGVSFDVKRGTSVAITGPSGCGKSTLLGLVAGLERPTSGRIALGDDEISALPEPDRARLRRAALGLVFQADNLLPFLTVVENVALRLALGGCRDGYGRCVELLDELGLADQLHKLPDQLSGGQRQRVAVARALIHRPSLILADEPTGSLDSAAADEVMELLVDAAREQGTSVLMVTHEPRVAAYADRTVLVRDGVAVLGLGAAAP
jgi:putative ABC transport system ATP-binding protein